MPVLILGTHITALGVLRMLTARGVEAFVVDETTDIITRSRWYRPPERTLAETSESDTLADYLQSLELPKAVLIGCSDTWTRAVAGLPPAVRERFPASVAPLETITQLVDKSRFSALVERLGIPHPQTLLVRDVKDLDALTDAQLANAFLKPTDSQSYHRIFGTKGSFADSRQSAARIVERTSAAGISLMVQEWIPGKMANTILLDGFVDRSGAIKAMLARRRIRMDPPRIAATCSDVTIPIEEVAEPAAAMQRLLADVGYRGIFNVEFKFDERDGLFKIIEVNPRPFWFIGHIVRAGLDLPWMSYLDAQDLEVPSAPRYQVGRYGVYEVPDANAILRAWSSFRRPEGPVLRPWLTGDHTLFWLRDPLPGLADVWHAIQRRVRGAFSRVRPRRPRSAT